MPDDIALQKTVNLKRDAIIAAAAELFLEHGFGDVSMDAIAAKAEVSKNTVYSHFENKAKLFEGIMGETCACRDFVGQHFDEDTGVPIDPPEKLLTQLGRNFLGFISSKESVALYRVVMAEGNKFPELGKTFFEYGPETLCLALTDYFEDQTAKGVLRIENSRTAAQQFLSMLTGSIMMELTIGVRGSATEKEIDDIVDAAVSTFLRAFRA